MTPEDARKDRFNGPDPDSCPDCLHAKDECVCEPEDEIDGVPISHIQRMLEHGLKNRREEGCAYCETHKNDHMMPPHKASDHCESGKHPHCTCDICY